MSAWTIFPVCVGTMKQVEKSNYTYGYNQGIKLDVCSLIYLLKGGPEPIIVDTGMSEPGWATQHHHLASRETSQEPLVALQKLGISCDDIRTVIFTHLHWDHCFNNDLFPKARFLVQKDEIQYALFPLPIHALYYEAPSLGMTPAWLKDMGRFEVIDGDREILPGLSIVKLPGHSPGFQGVNVHTRKGNYLVGSDFCPLFENWPSMDKEPIPSTVHLNLLDYYQSFKRAAALSKFVLPGHDLRVLEQTSYPAGR